jgi:4-amino-4-deoxy-L-arabinose transferase-like glycosyltransferase
MKVLKITAIMFMLLCGSFAIRLYHLNRQPLSHGEMLSLCIANGVYASDNGYVQIQSNVPEFFTHQDIRSWKTLTHVHGATLHDSGNAVAYNVMLYVWTLIFGDSAASIRFLSLFFGMLTVILGYYFCRQLFNERTANIAGVLLCLHPVLIEYGQIARAFVPATFFILLATYNLYQVTVSKRHVWLHIPLYILSLNISLLSHYVTLYVFLSHLFLVALFYGYRKALLQYAAMTLVGFGVFAVWLMAGGWSGKKPIHIEEEIWRVNQASQWAPDNEVSSVWEYVKIMAGNVSRIVGNEADADTLTGFGFLLVVLPILTKILAFRNVRKSEFFRQVMYVSVPLIAYVLFTLFFTIRTGHSVACEIRYAVFIIPFSILLISFGIDRWMQLGGWNFTAASCVLIVVGITFFAGFFPGVMRSGTIREGESFALAEAADIIAQNSNTNDTLVFHSERSAILLNLMLPKDFLPQQQIDPSIPENTIQWRNIKVNHQITIPSKEWRPIGN